jgi:hypothetical membrane protein
MSVSTQAVPHPRATHPIHNYAGLSLWFAGLLLAIVGAGFMTVIMLGASVAPGYDYSGGAISDLGVVPETATLFNVTLIAIGVLNAVAGYVLYLHHRRAWLLAPFVLGGVGAFGAGVFPLDTGQTHSLFALAGFMFFNIEAVAIGIWLRSAPMKALSLVAGLLGLAFVVIMIIGDAGNPAVFGPIGHGGAERMIVYPVMLWLVAFGGYLLAARADAEALRRS